MHIFSQNELEDIFRLKYKNLKERFIMSELERHLSRNDTKVCCLYGLRRTGKTTMLFQSAVRHEHSLMILCEDNDSMYQLRKIIDSHPEAKYIYIDEITKTKDFLRTASILSDKYVSSGKRIVLSGTDSLGFYFVKNTELLDRINLIHSTYIPFREHTYLLGGNILDYINYGGVLTDGKELYNKDNLNEYSDSSISSNIIHSIEKLSDKIDFGVLKTYQANNELKTFIEKVIEINNRSFVAEVINRSFKSHDLGSLADLMTKSFIDIGDPDIINNVEMNKRIRAFLGIRYDTLDRVEEKGEAQIIDYLTKLDLLIRVGKTDEYIFVQPGLRHAQLENTIDALVTSEEFENYSEFERYEIIKKLKSDISGKMLEDIITAELLLEKRKDFVSVEKYRDKDGRELDITVSNFETKSAVVFEVKLSDKIVEEQSKHLRNDETIRSFEEKSGVPVVGKAVIYNGTSCYDVNSDIIYINAAQFLCSKDVMVDILNTRENDTFLVIVF